MNSNLLSALFGLLVLVGIVVSQEPKPAAAVDLPDNCNTTRAKIWWHGFPNDLESVAQSGANYWESFRNWKGNGPAVDVSHDGSFLNNTVDATWGWVPGGGWGWGVCKLPQFKINSGREAEWRQEQWKFKSAGAHELGHVLGLGHVGKNDSWDGVIPIMATCRGGTNFSQDDAAGANALGNRSGAFFNATANSSFENSATKWGRYNVSWYSRSGGVDGSARHLEISRNSNTAYIFSTTRIADNQGHTLDALKARANYKKNDGRDTGYVTVVLRVGKYTYPTVPDTCGEPDFDGHDGKERDINAGTRNTSWYVWISKNCYPNNSWTYCTTDPVDPSSADVFDSRVYVYNRMSRPGVGYTRVDLDRVRVMAEF